MMNGCHPPGPHHPRTVVVELKADSAPSSGSPSASPNLSERWLPDAFIFALLATVVVVIERDSPPAALTPGWHRGHLGKWLLVPVPFTMQMALIVITGTVVATAPPVRRAINVLASSPARQSRAVVFVGVAAMVTSWFNRGFGLVFSCGAGPRGRPSTGLVDYRTLAA